MGSFLIGVSVDKVTNIHVEVAIEAASQTAALDAAHHVVRSYLVDRHTLPPGAFVHEVMSKHWMHDAQVINENDG